MSQNSEDRVPIVGIGASAGGIEALEHFFRATPRTIGAAFVIVTHLNPNRESVLASILQRWTEMVVERSRPVEDGMLALANHIYVMPENASIKISGGRFQLLRPRSTQRDHAPIDLFLSSLALDLGERAVAIILSGRRR